MSSIILNIQELLVKIDLLMNTGLTKFIFRFISFFVIILIIVSTGTVLWVHKLAKEIPPDKVITDFSHNAVTTIYDNNGYFLTSIQEDKKQIWVPLTQISDSIKKAIVATEDPYFFRHSGIDYRQTWEAVKDNLRLRRLVRGGSTITQQVAKNIYLSSEKTITRKIKEYFLAKRMETLLPKERIIEMYLNEIGWGYGIYGVELASRFYLDKHANEVNTSEGAFLTAMLRNPAYYNPYKKMESIMKRQQLVLKLMLRHNLISQEEYDNAISQPIELRRDKPHKRFTQINLDRPNSLRDTPPCYAGLIEGYLYKTFGRDLLYNVGLTVRTTLDNNLQNKLDDIIDEIDQVNKGSLKRASDKIGLLLDEGDKVRAIGCTEKGDEVKGWIKRLGIPYNSYRYEIKFIDNIVWKDILLVHTDEDRLL